jgi:hypothetical protein
MGTPIAGVVGHGRFASTDGWVFYGMHDPDACVTLKLNDDEYKRAVFQVDDKGSTASLTGQLISTAS